MGLLDEPKAQKDASSMKDLDALASDVESKLMDFGIKATVVAVLPGPVVTRFELKLEAGTKVSRITGLAKDLARSLSVVSVRVVEVIPGKSVIGLELPNDRRETVYLKEMITSSEYRKMQSLNLSLGKDVSGEAVIVDLSKMPHLLVAGTTGSGKSVGLNAMLLSLLYCCTPEQLRLILVDPKMLELNVYEGVPHLLAPVVTDMKQAGSALRWCVAEMDRRYQVMAAMGVRNLAGYNRKVGAMRREDAPEPMPSIVVVIDEFADMIMVVGKTVEQMIARIAQKARAAGIHLILATQRPSVDVITGLIKANIPTRIAFQVSSKIDSRTILDMQGAEQLLGHGDMLFLPPGTSTAIRVHGAFVDDDEVNRVVAAWRASGAPEYIEDILKQDEEGAARKSSDDEDTLYDEVLAFVVEQKKASISSVQRRFKIGYNRAARLVESLEAQGVIAPMGSGGAREVLIDEIPS